jgi:large subunit ribosomal protein L19
MNDLLSNFALEQAKKIHAIRKLSKFKVGDTVNVKYKITEGGSSRIQAFKGVVIAKTKDDSNYSATFTVRKVSSNIGVERKFMVCSPLLSAVEVLKQGVVRRSKLYYLRSLTGKASRIREKLDFLTENAATEDASA